MRGTRDPYQPAFRSPWVLLRWILLSFGLPGLALAGPLLPPRFAWAVDAADVQLLLLLGFVNAGMFAAATQAWRFPLKRLTTGDDLVRESASRERFAAVAGKSYGLKQVILPIAGAVTPVVVMFQSGTVTAHALAITANIAWTGFFFGNVSYWLIVPPFLVIKIRSSTDLTLRWNDPARTPGLRTLSEGYAFPAVFLALAAFAVTLPGLLRNQPLLGDYQPLLYGVILGLSLWVGVLPQLVIFRIVRRFRLRILDTLAGSESYRLSEQRAADIFARARDTEHAPITLSAYNSIAGAPSLPFATSLIVQYFAAVIGSFIGFLLQ